MIPSPTATATLIPVDELEGVDMGMTGSKYDLPETIFEQISEQGGVPILVDGVAGAKKGNICEMAMPKYLVTGENVTPTHGDLLGYRFNGEVDRQAVWKIDTGNSDIHCVAVVVKDGNQWDLESGTVVAIFFIDGDKTGDELREGAIPVIWDENDNVDVYLDADSNLILTATKPNGDILNYAVDVKVGPPEMIGNSVTGEQSTVKPNLIIYRDAEGKPTDVYDTETGVAMPINESDIAIIPAGEYGELEMLAVNSRDEGIDAILESGAVWVEVGKSADVLDANGEVDHQKITRMQIGAMNKFGDIIKNGGYLSYGRGVLKTLTDNFIFNASVVFPFNNDGEMLKMVVIDIYGMKDGGVVMVGRNQNEMILIFVKQSFDQVYIGEEFPYIEKVESYDDY